MFSSATKTQAWQTLEKLAEQASTVHLNDLFAQDAARAEHFSQRMGGLLLDYSKQRLDQTALGALVALAEASDLQGWTKRLFSDEKINHTEQRAARHWALRDFSDAAQEGEVQKALARLGVLTQRIQQREWRGLTGEPITDVVNLGVGGSELGPLLVVKALEDMALPEAPRVHFVSTMDGSQISALLPSLRPQSTLFVISSKSFGTVDTLYNAQTALQWLRASLGDSEALHSCHFIGVSAAPEKMTAWGIPPSNQLMLWDWVGGRFSLWSAIGFPIALTIGYEAFVALLQGAERMDKHFREAPLAENLPVLLALLGVWNSSFLNIRAHAVLPYDGRLKFLPAFLTQLEMESNGKSVNRAGEGIDYQTCPVIWGEVGSKAQHAFYQLLHQGTEPVSCDFFITARRRPINRKEDEALQQQHLLSVANCIAQSRLLAFGHQSECQDLHQCYRGNQPSSTLLLDELTPENLGALLVAYEHKVFVQSVIWEINPFDQWGVEKGKAMATETQQWLQQGVLPEGQDGSTIQLLRLLLNKN